MNRIKLNATPIVYLVIFIGFIPGWIMSTVAQEIHEKDSIKVEELLVKDTLDLEINGPSNEVSFYMNGMVFLSDSKYHQKMIPDHITFGVVKSYFAPLDYISLESSSPLFANDNFPYPPAGMSFTRDYKKIYFTKSVELEGKAQVEKIFEMSIFEGEASEHIQLPFTTGPSRYLHPAISIDESFIIFSSDASPSKGGLDLFISRRSSDGWSPPESMGSLINTSSHEWYPFLDYNNNLYFSSSGHMGFGGYDVFVCYFNGSGWERPQNLSNYINTEEDELGFSIHPNKQLAIFTRVINESSDAKVLMVKLNENVLLASDEGSSKPKDVSLLLKDLIWSGYASGNYTPSALIEGNPLAISAPLIGGEKKEESKSPPPVEKTTAATPVKKVVSQLDPSRVTFRVQILSSTKANSRPEVSIGGKPHPTFEYYYKGAYRITVGEFVDLDEANAFRTKCKNSGFNQAWVAAFRGNKRETDPSVFRK
jgi:hypothetical protein